MGDERLNIQDIRLMYEYNFWANRRILGACTKLSQTQFSAPSTTSAESLRGALVHTLDAEYGWRMRFQHDQGSDILAETDFPTVEALQERWQVEENDMRVYLASLHDDELNSVLRYPIPEGERARVLWHCLYHVVNHGTQHRSEVAVILTEYGHSPGDMDFTVFLLER
jgi:uncharacterized damage-inducible protein DinB